MTSARGGRAADRRDRRWPCSGAPARSDEAREYSTRTDPVDLDTDDWFSMLAWCMRRRGRARTWATRDLAARDVRRRWRRTPGGLRARARAPPRAGGRLPRDGRGRHRREGPRHPARGRRRCGCARSGTSRSPRSGCAASGSASGSDASGRRSVRKARASRRANRRRVRPPDQPVNAAGAWRTGPRSTAAGTPWRPTARARRPRRA